MPKKWQWLDIMHWDDDSGCSSITFLSKGWALFYMRNKTALSDVYRVVHVAREPSYCAPDVIIHA